MYYHTPKTDTGIELSQIITTVAGNFRLFLCDSGGDSSGLNRCFRQRCDRQKESGALKLLLYGKQLPRTVICLDYFPGFVSEVLD